MDISEIKLDNGHNSHYGPGNNGRNHDNYGCLIEEQNHYGPPTKKMKKKNSFVKKI